MGNFIGISNAIGGLNAGKAAPGPTNYTVDYLVIAAGGGGGGTQNAGGGGAGGLRQFTSQPVSVQGYPVTVGGGGAGRGPGAAPVPAGTSGSTSTFISNSSADMWSLTLLSDSSSVTPESPLIIE